MEESRRERVTGTFLPRINIGKREDDINFLAQDESRKTRMRGIFWLSFQILSPAICLSSVSGEWQQYIPEPDSWGISKLQQYVFFHTVQWDFRVSAYREICSNLCNFFIVEPDIVYRELCLNACNFYLTRTDLKGKIILCQIDLQTDAIWLKPRVRYVSLTCIQCTQFFSLILQYTYILKMDWGGACVCPF